MPSEQRHDYNRYMGLAFVAGCQMGAVVHVIKNQIDSLEYGIERMELMKRAARVLEEDDTEAVQNRQVRPWRSLVKKPARPEQDLVTVPFFLRCLAEEARENAFKELCVRWRELRSVEVVTDEIAATFDGEDPLHPQVRGWIEDAREQALVLCARLGGKRRLPEPGEAYLNRTRDLVAQGFAALGLVEE